MKNLKKLLFVGMIVTGLSSQAQDKNNRWAVSFGVNAVDYRSSAGSEFMDHFDQPFMVDEHWNILPSVSYFGVSRYLGSGFILGIAGSVNKIDKYVVSPGVVVNPGDLMYYGTDLTVTYSFMEILGSKVIDPTLSLGGGYTFLDKESYGTLNPGIGLNIWFTENIGLSFLGVYKKSFGDREYPGVTPVTPDAPSYTQYSVGLSFKFGAKDTDGDGIYDKEDACPEVAGLKEFKGCPDTDGDGIEDAKDKCPTAVGTVEFQGCPDGDNDGVVDPDDACPTVAGLKQFNGCPDTDNDGTPDPSDKCPTVSGPVSNGGCPIPVLDADGDTVPDTEDACPLVAGPADNRGCPKVTEETLETLRVEARSIFFETGKATFSKLEGDTSGRLDAIREVLKNYPTAKFAINGHTDNVGKPAANLKLSQARAKAVYDALVARGINPANLTYEGFGDKKPVASNKTAKGRAQNRRTEIVYLGGVDGTQIRK